MHFVLLLGNRLLLRVFVSDQYLGMGIILLYLTIITVNVLSIFGQIYEIEGVENKHSLFLPLDSL